MVSASPDSALATLLFHGLWLDGRFHVWAERLGETNGEQSSDHAPNETAPLKHPFAACAADIQAAIGELSPDALLAAIAQESTLRLRLPGVQNRPLSSDHAGPTADEPARLMPFQLPALTFSPADAIDLLTSLSDAALRSCGDSIRYWARLASQVLALVSRQQFIPDMEETVDSTFTARWRLSLADRREVSWLERMVGAMPPICRCGTGHQPVDGAPIADRPLDEPTSLVEGFLAATTDALIRRSLSQDSFFDDIHERAREEGGWELSWLSALLGEDRTVRGEREEISTVAAQVGAWIGQASGEDFESPPRLCFCLEEPDAAEEESGASWRLEFEFRSAEDDRLMDVPSVWAEPAAGPTILGGRMTSRREHLLSELTRAGQIYEPISRCLAAAAPTGVDLSTSEAHAFLREWAPLLTAHGFPVETPAWARESDHRLGLQLFLKPAGEEAGEVSLGTLGLGTLLEFDWRVALGDERLSMEEFERLASQQAPLVRLHGKWVGIDADAATKALAFLRKQASGQMTLLEAIRLAGGAEESEAGLPIVGLSGSSWVEQFLRETPKIEVQPLPQPEEFKGTLRPYQLRGLSWMAFLDRLGIGACLADDMGLGKTIQLIALLQHERAVAEGVGPTLLFAPMSVVGNWQREIGRFAPRLRVFVFHGPMRLTGQAFLDAAASHDVVITTYGLAHRELKNLSSVAWHRIALDEAQKIKNPSANQTIAMRSLRATHRLALTGTPIENHLSELWSIMETLNPGLLGSATSFRSRFAVPVEKLGDNERAAQLSRMIRPFVLRRLKSDPTVICDLPEKMEMRVFCNLTAEQAALYQRIVSDMLIEVERSTGIRRRGLILATLTKLKQVCNHPAHYLKAGTNLDGRSGKCERLVEMLEEVLEEGDAALVFTQYREMGDLLQPMLARRLSHEIPFLHGGTPMKKRNEMINRFQDPTTPARIFLLSLKAGGFGLNLTRANHVFHYDRWWNPAVEEQATDRVHRIGQTRRVQVHKFVCIGTVEDRIDKLLTEKSALAERIVGSGDEWLTGLTTQQLREYLTLSDEAVADE